MIKDIVFNNYFWSLRVKKYNKKTIIIQLFVSNIQKCPTFAINLGLYK